MFRKILLALAILVLGSGSALASNCNAYPYTLQNGQTADANQVMSNFNNVLSCANNNLAHNGANSDITSLTGLSTPLAPSQGGTVIFTGGTTTGSANAQVLAAVTPSAFVLTPGYIVTFTAGFSNTTAITLNVNATGATSAKKIAAGAVAALVTGDIISGLQYQTIYDGTEYVILNPSSTVTGPGSSTSGNIATYSGTSGALLGTGLAVPVTPANGGTGAATLAAHGVVVGNGTSTVNVTTAGTSGQVLTSNGASADPTFQAPTPFTASFTSSQQAIPAGGATLTVAHGLGAAPFLTYLVLHCVTIDGGYAVGDEIVVPAHDPGESNSNGFAVYADATNVNVVQGSVGNLFYLNKSTGAGITLTQASWKIIVKAVK